MALVMAIDLGLAVLVAIIILVQVLTSGQPPSAAADKPSTVTVQPATIATGPIPSLTFPALPTVNPTPLVALPNQGQSDAPPLPPGLQSQPTLTPGTTK
ncbi:MAG: hypothetical protein BGO39_21300 [Chloroflexi bacterium 54-19]|nr:MAG: hypothetical protein BGO39_21300 [Chloroflexi bacterium 54-19]